MLGYLGYYVHLLAVTFSARRLTPLRGWQLHLKLPIPGRVAAAPHTGGPEDLCAVPQLTVCINLLHVGDSHAFVSATGETCRLADLPYEDSNLGVHS